MDSAIAGNHAQVPCVSFTRRWEISRRLPVRRVAQLTGRERSAGCRATFETLSTIPAAQFAPFAAQNLERRVCARSTGIRPVSCWLEARQVPPSTLAVAGQAGRTSGIGIKTAPLALWRRAERSSNDWIVVFLSPGQYTWKPCRLRAFLVLRANLQDFVNFC